MSNLKRICTILLVLALTLSTAPFVLAEDENTSLVDPTKQGSITIHKFDDLGTSEELGKLGNGTEIKDTTGFGNPVGGIRFTVTFLPGTTSNITVLQALELIDAMSDEDLTANQRQGMTDPYGIYKFANLVQGIYLVQELPNEGTTNMIPSFLVSIPMTHPVNHSNWLYDIHVYPKNTIAPGTIDKKVLDSDGKKQSSIAANIGEEVEWVITSTIPGAMSAIDPSNNAKGYFYITDSLDSRLNYMDIKVELVSPAGVRETMTLGEHYILTAPTVGTAGIGDNDIIVDFKTAEGLQLLGGADVNSKIEITVTTVINETAAINLAIAISNSAKMYYSGTGDPANPVDPPILPLDPDPEVKLRGIAIRKVGEISQLLNGATFTIYKELTDAEKGIALQVDGSDWTETSGASLEVVGSATGTYVDGYLYFSGEMMDKLGQKCEIGTTYYFVETTAPTGYDLLSSIYALVCGTTTTITNIKSPSFVLPITGGSGTLLLTVIGIVLIGGAGTLLLVYRKKEKKKSKS